MDFNEIALRIDKVVGESGSERVRCIEVFDGSILSVKLLDGNAVEGGRLWLEGQCFHLREMVDAFGCTDFDRFFGRTPSIGGGEFKGADEVGMLKHEDIGRRGDALAGNDFGLAKKEDNQVEGMDVKVE